MGYSEVGRRVSILSTIVTLLLPTTCTAFMRGYLPLTQSEISKRFPMPVLGTRFHPWDGGAARVGTTTVRFVETGNLILFSGTDRVHKTWTVSASAMQGGALYSADLDNNGTMDLLYAAYTGGNGLAPPMHVLTLMFDDTGRPVPCEMDGYFEIDGRGLLDIIDLDGDRRADFIRQAYDDGYWITSVYEAKDARWHLISGQHASRTFSIYTRFTNRANRVPTTPAPGRHPVEDDLSNNATAYSGRLHNSPLGKRSAIQGSSAALVGQNGLCPVAWYSSMVVVLDTALGRRAATLGAPEEAHRLLTEIMRTKLAVDVKGQRRYRGDQKSQGKRCVPETIWASAP